MVGLWYSRDAITAAKTTNNHVLNKTEPLLRVALAPLLPSLQWPVFSWLPGATPAFKPPPGSSATPPSGGGPIESTFDVIRGVLSEDVVSSTKGIYRFDLSGNEAPVKPQTELLMCHVTQLQPGHHTSTTVLDGGDEEFEMTSIRKNNKNETNTINKWLNLKERRINVHICSTYIEIFDQNVNLLF